MVDFCIIVLNFRPILLQKERKRNETVPFCVPLISEAFLPSSFLNIRNAFLNTLLFFPLGISIQIWLTRSGIYHEEQFPPLKHRHKPESREERKQRKYRYLYQVNLHFLQCAKKVRTQSLHTYVVT